MTFDEILDHLAGLDGVRVQRPGPGDGSPEIAWGDAFFYYWPDDGTPAGQPFATITTKDYPGEPPAGLDRPGAFRLNLQADRAFLDRIETEQPDEQADPTATDTFAAHPTYPGWVTVIEPRERTAPQARALLDAAHAAAAGRHRRRAR